MSEVFFTSDPHAGHGFMAELRGFESVDAHDAAILDSINSAVGKHDTLWILGDLTMHWSTGLEWARKLRAGRKMLVLGNHDAAHPMHRRSSAALRGALEVFDVVTPLSQVKFGEQKVMLSHFPYAVDHYENSRFMEWRLRDEGLFLLHGHTHTNQIVTGPREIHVGYDAWKAPVSRDTLKSVMETMS